MMQSSNWALEHSEALREYVVRGMSYSEAVDAINGRFGTAYTRSAAIGRARRMGFDQFKRAGGTRKSTCRGENAGLASAAAEPTQGG